MGLAHLCRVHSGAILCVCVENTSREPGLARVNYELNYGHADFEMLVRHPDETPRKPPWISEDVFGGGMYMESWQHTDDKATGKIVWEGILRN